MNVHSYAKDERGPVTKRIPWWLLPSLLSLVCCGDNSEPLADASTGTTGMTPDTGAATGEPDAATTDASTEQESFMGGAGIGITDMDASFAFYSEVLGMSLRYDLPVPGYVNEKILHYPDGKGSDVVLMSYIDDRERNFLNNPVKLVFYVPDAMATVEAIRGRGLEVLSEPAAQAAFGGAIVGFARDPDGYVLEIVETGEDPDPYLGAVGLGVSDLEQSKAFYTRFLGMQPQGDLLSIPGVWDEWIMQHQSGRGSAVVLLHYTDGSERNYTNVPVKTVHFVPDVQATVEALRAEGFPILSEPMQFTVEGSDAMIALARDPDGYILELVTPL